MRRSPRVSTLALAVILAASLAALGCASRKKVSTAEPAPPAAPPTETETTPPPPTEPPPPTTEAEPTPSGLQDAFFDYDDASLRPDAKTALEGDGKYLEHNSSVNIIVEGHCDERGSVEYNLALGERRARAAKEFLTSYGIPATRITTISYGKERPFDTGHDEAAWAKCRRAHFVTK